MWFLWCPSQFYATAKSLPGFFTVPLYYPFLRIGGNGLQTRRWTTRTERYIVAHATIGTSMRGDVNSLGWKFCRKTTKRPKVLNKRHYKAKKSTKKTTTKRSKTTAKFQCRSGLLLQMTNSIYLWFLNADKGVYCYQVLPAILTYSTLFTLSQTKQCGQTV